MPPLCLAAEQGHLQLAPWWPRATGRRDEDELSEPKSGSRARRVGGFFGWWPPKKVMIPGHVDIGGSKVGAMFFGVDCGLPTELERGEPLCSG